MPATMSAYTSVNKEKVPRLFTWAAEKSLIRPGMRVLDYGCGRWPETVAGYLAALGVEDVDQWDPNWFPDADWIPFEGYDAVCLSNVLNVIESERDRKGALKAAWDALRPGGVMLVTVYEGDGSGASGPSRDGCWQERRGLADYVGDELAPYLGTVVKGTRLWASIRKPEKGERYYPPIGTKVTVHMLNGSCRPYTVVGTFGGKLQIRQARLIFDGPHYYDTVADRIEEGHNGDPEEELVWHRRFGDWHGRGKNGGWPTFGVWEHAPNLD